MKDLNVGGKKLTFDVASISSNGAKFTICQVTVSTKCSHDLITPLFVGVDISPKVDVVIICNIDLKVEAEVLLSHFGIYAAVIFGSIVITTTTTTTSTITFSTTTTTTTITTTSTTTNKSMKATKFRWYHCRRTRC